MNSPLSSESASAPASVQLVDCWNKIGIWGDQGCAKLETAIHCRNCAVYSAAASQLLDADIPADYLQRWTKHFAKAKSTNTGQTRTLFLFRIGVEWLALSPVVLQEITTQKPVHSVPHRRNNVLLGVVNIGGELVICVSLHAMLGVENKVDTAGERNAKDRARFFVALHGGSRFVFPVDEVHGIFRFQADEFEDLPTTLAKGNSTHTKATVRWEGKSVGWLDDDLLFYALNRSLG